SHRLSVSIVLGMVNSVVICFWRNDYNLHHAVQKIITKDQHALGFAALRGGNYLTHLFVANSQQGSGLGRTLLNHLLNLTDAREVSLRSSVNAVGFYSRNGFVATGEEAEFNGIRFVPMSLVRT
ncbi:GNAT family N-acetyltransferase, partial [Vibrio parahaemolyticus]